MQTKLTLSIEKSVISHAKVYARHRKKSLSQIIEDYLKALYINDGQDKITPDTVPPITKSLEGILKGKKEIDYRSSMVDYLENKYK